MEYEKVIDKVKKLQALAEGGMMGEKEAAQRALNALCIQYNINLEDLFEEKKSWKHFKLPYHDSFARKIMFQCYAKVTNNRRISYREGRYNNQISFELTDLEYVELEEMYSFYFDQWQKEKKRMMDSLIDAYINKHDLFSKDAGEDEGPKKPMTSERWKKILEMQALMDQLESVSFYKRLE